MKKIYVVALVLTIFACAKLPAQTFSLTADREPVASLDGLWRFHPGDNPQWANPDFDDSQWPLIHSDRPWTSQGYRNLSGFAWYRFAIQEPVGNEPLSLLLTRILTSYRVYADGQLMGGLGYMPPHDLAEVPRFAAYDLPRAPHAGPRVLQIAVRVWHDPEWASYEPGGTQQPGNAVGSRSLIHQRIDEIRGAFLARLVDGYAYSILASIFGLLALGLFLFRPPEREYLWFALVLLSSGADAAASLAMGLSAIPIETFDYIESSLIVVFHLAALLFFSRVLLARRGIWWRVACAAAILDPLTVALYTLHLTPVAVSSAAEPLLFLPAEVWILAVLLRRAAQRNVDAELLLVPVLLAFGYKLVEDLTQAAFQFGWLRKLLRVNLQILYYPYAVTLKVIVFTIFVAAMMLFLIRRFSQARREEERLAGELEAARSMQSLMLPASDSSTPGFRLESVYVPASEVGGDFFQVLPALDGSLLIVVGDVSGKGLKAAMTVSAIIGALRDEKTIQPAQVLVHLNRVLRGQISGFVTCFVTLIGADGAMTVANAGHLSPYLNGKELAVPAGLPLGIDAGAIYDETRFELSPGGRLTFVSDGVVEARAPKGELFGFDRTAAISNQSADAIAKAAQAFGQEDDITVLTVARAAKLEAVTA